MSSIIFSIDTLDEQPPYRQLEADIRDKILSGRLRPGDRLPTIRAICGQTGLAYGTVSKVTRALVEEGVLEAKVGSGTRVAERDRKRPLTGCYGVASVVSLSEMRRISPYFTAAFMAVQDEVVSSGRMVAYDRWSRQRAITRLFNGLTAVDGLIVFNGIGVTARDIRALQAAMPHVVLLGGAIRMPDVTTVHADNVADSREAVERLIELGHRRVAYVSNAPDTVSATERRRGWEEAMQGAGLPTGDAWAIIGEGNDLARGYLAMRERPTALFVANSVQELPKALPLLYSNGVHLGRDLQIAAWDEAHFHTLSTLAVPHVRITQPIDTLGHLAAKALGELIGGQRREPGTILLRSRIETIGHPIPGGTP